jgi:hypothetical protein
MVKRLFDILFCHVLSFVVLFSPVKKRREPKFKYFDTASYQLAMSTFINKRLKYNFLDRLEKEKVHGETRQGGRESILELLKKEDEKEHEQLKRDEEEKQKKEREKEENERKQKLKEMAINLNNRKVRND